VSGLTPFQALFYSYLQFRNVFFDPERIVRNKEILALRFADRAASVRRTCDRFRDRSPDLIRDPEAWRDMMYFNFRRGFIWCTVHKARPNFDWLNVLGQYN
jgi:hypothetical protein